MAENQELDAKVLALIAKVKEKRAKVATLKRPQWLTTCSLVLPGWERINIQVHKNMVDLVIAAGILKSYQDMAENGDALIGVKVPAPRWQNYPITDWLADIRRRVESMAVNQEQAKLEELEAALNELTSPEQRRQMKLAEIEEKLAD